MSGAAADRYRRSNALLERALKTIPLASQTFSKSHTQYPKGAAPLFLERGRGGRVWDVDGNEYVDLVGALLPVVLGYCDPDVDAAIRRQLDRGIVFSLATELEIELAEKLVEVVPCAEMVRFGKNGSDATAAAIRLARAFTGRDHIATCGYHGWQDWYIGATTRHKGVPDAVRALTHRFPYNDADALDRLLTERPGAYAAVIMEPMTTVDPAPDYLATVREIAHRHGALLIFDEIVTGFRFATGGAGALFGVVPDLACFGKSLGNGMPISVVCGRADVMREMEQVFVSGTYGGEALSLAAALAVLAKMQREPVIETLWRTGDTLAAQATAAITRHGLNDVFGYAGKAPWMLLTVRQRDTTEAAALRTLFKREMLANGVLMGGSHNVYYAHNAADVAHVAQAYDRTMATIAAELDTGRLTERLGQPPIRPVFEVRATG